MPERQTSPGEVTSSRPEPDAMENGHGSGGEQQTAPGGDTARQAALAEATAQVRSDAEGNGDAAVSENEAVNENAAVQTGAGGAAGNGSPAAVGSAAANGSAPGAEGTAGSTANGSSAGNGSSGNGSSGNGTPQPVDQSGEQTTAVPITGARPSLAPRPAGPPRPSPRPQPASGRPSPSAGQQANGEQPTTRTPATGPSGDESPTVRTPTGNPAQPASGQSTAGQSTAAQSGAAQETSEQPTAAQQSPAQGGGSDAATGAVRQAPPVPGTWFTPVDAEVTQVLPRMPAPPQPAPEPATEVIPVTPRVTEQVAQPTSALPPQPPPPGSEQAAEPDEPKPRRRKILVLSAVVGALVLLYAGDLLLGSGSVPRGVTVAGVAVGGLPFDEAEQKLRAEIEPRTTKPVPVTVGDATSEVDPTTAGLAVDWPGTIAQVRDQPLNPITRITSFFTRHETGVVTTTDPAALNNALEELSPVVDRAPVEGSVRFDGTDPQPVDPVAGQQLDVAAAAEVLQREWASGGPVALPLTELPATTTPEDVATAIDEVAKPAVSGPVTVTGENGVKGTITPQVIASALVFEAENGALVPQVNQQAVQDALAPQMAPSERPGRDATLDFASGNPVIVPSQDGRGVDYKATLADLLSVLSSTGQREITAVYADQPAKVTTEDLQALGNPQIIGQFQTGGFAQDSGVNIRRAAELINGIVVQPGETFSLDAATGPRVASNGYIEAGVIDNGAPARGMAGGVSQVSTTLYNAAYFAGMTLIEHKAHSFYISRYPAGREATIATGAIDNRWRNDNPTPVLIRTAWTPSTVTVWIYGQRQFEVTGAFGPRTNPTQPNTVNIPPGKECHPSNGGPGFTITDTRTLRNVSTGEVRTETITTRYNPIPRVICG